MVYGGRFSYIFVTPTKKLKAPFSIFCIARSMLYKTITLKTAYLIKACMYGF